MQLKEKHPCDIGEKELYHDLVEHWDSQGDGIYSQDYSWVECARCGATHDEDATIPETL